MRGRAAVALGAAVIALVSVAPAGADPTSPMDPIPGDGFFLVGQDISPGLYRTGGSGADKDNVVETNISIGPMYANIGSSVKAFESRNCQPWSRVT